MSDKKPADSTLGWLSSALRKPFFSPTPEPAKKRKDKRRFWKKSPSHVPGSVQQIRGAAYPPAEADSASLSPSHSSNAAVSEGSVESRNHSRHASDTAVTRSASTSQIDRGNAQPFPSPLSGHRSHSSFELGRDSLVEEELSHTDSDVAESKASNHSGEHSKLFSADSEESLDGSRKRTRINKFLERLEDNNMDMASLRKLSWSGVDTHVRSLVWQILLGYLPANRKRRQPTLQKRRAEFQSYLSQYYYIPDSDRSESELALMHQIRIDVIRTCPGYKLFQVEALQLSLERILYIWAIRHPASGYVQGINDIATPFFVVFLSAVTGIELRALDKVTVEMLERITPEHFAVVEADSFWCLSKLLDGIQDHYTFAQPGIQRMVFKLKELMHRIDEELVRHLEEQGVEFIQFAFRWMNCLLMRELSLPLIVRTWDSYLSEPNGAGFKSFHVYVCAAFLKRWAVDLKTMEFQDLVVFLQNPPTDAWTEKDIETLIAQAYVYQSLFDDAPKHLE